MKFMSAASITDVIKIQNLRETKKNTRHENNLCEKFSFLYHPLKVQDSSGKRYFDNFVRRARNEVRLQK
jgi:hypothetical protein